MLLQVLLEYHFHTWRFKLFLHFRNSRPEKGLEPLHLLAFVLVLNLKGWNSDELYRLMKMHLLSLILVAFDVLFQAACFPLHAYLMSSKSSVWMLILPYTFHTQSHLLSHLLIFIFHLVYLFQFNKVFDELYPKPLTSRKTLKAVLAWSYILDNQNYFYPFAWSTFISYKVLLFISSHHKLEDCMLIATSRF